MTGNVTYLVDCSSFQGLPDWAKVAATCGGGAEKVTEGTSYVNPDWAASKTALKSLAARGFVPLAYFFLDAAGTGAAQADFFAKEAGDLTGFGIVIDVERSSGSPTLAQAQQAAAEVRRKYPGVPVGGYAPHWYTGNWNLTCFDWLWASEYVSGSGDPSRLYAQVPASWWAPYGERTPALLQFTSSASVAGVSGAVDCSAFHGTAAQLGSRVLKPKTAPAPAPKAAQAAPAVMPGDDDMLIAMNPGDTPVTFPVWADAGAYKEPAAYKNVSLIATGGAGAVIRVTLYEGSGASAALNHTMSAGHIWAVVPPKPWSSYQVVEVQRTDTKKGTPATAMFRTW